MKPILIFVFLCTMLDARDKAGTGVPTPWESLIVNPDKSNKLRVQIDGYLRVAMNNDGTFRFQIFADRDSLEKNRDFKFVEIESVDFIKALDTAGIKGIINIQELDRKFVTIKALFEKSELLSEENLLYQSYRIGNFKGPFLCLVDGLDKTIINN